MKASDLIFDRVDGGKYCDYWFRVTGETEQELTDHYMEQSMVGVTDAVFSIQDGQWGVRRQFPFNYDVVCDPSHTEFYELLKSVAFAKLKELNMKG